MHFPKSLHANGWHVRFPLRRPHPDMPLDAHDAVADDKPPHARRRFHILAGVVAVGALAASAGLDVVDDPRPLDVQLSTAMHKAGETLKGWQEALSRGLQVSLRAVADGRDTPEAPPAEPKKSGDGAATVVAQAEPVPSAASPADDRDQPVRVDVAPRLPQPTR